MNIEALLQQHFGFTEFRPGQREALEALEQTGKALAVFPTGGGKSLCYQLPALAYEGVTLVVSPLIALMKDQIDFLRGRGIEAARLDSSLSAEESRRVMEQAQAGSLKLLYVAPERFNNERFLSSLTRFKISLFAIDEAHCISEWGHNFRPDYLKLAEIARSLQVERILTLTATATPAVVESICAAFDIPAHCAVVTGFYRPNLNLCITPVESEAREELLLNRLKSRKPGPTIVYVTLQKTAEQVAKYLESEGFSAHPYHAGMEAEKRTEVQEWWMGSDRNIVVATIAFGMGIDKANVRYVYHYNLPKGLESYSQEIGRAGRDGLRSTVELFVCPEDTPTLENFAYGDTPTETALNSLLNELLTTRCAGDTETQRKIEKSSDKGVGAIENQKSKIETSDEFAISLYDLSNRHDLRPLVLRTALTYLELMGALRQGTPFYAGYEIRPLLPLEEILASFKGEPGQFLKALFGMAKKGRVWYALNPDEAAEALGQERRRIVRALEVLEERGQVELRLSDVRQRYTRLVPPEARETLRMALVEKFHQREAQEIARIAQVLSLVTHDGCQTNALVAHFGEHRAEPCGHCSYCLTGKPLSLPPLREAPPLPAGLDTEAFYGLCQAFPEALGDPRQAARFLCGLTSPALVRNKLTRDPLFGVWENRHFKEALDWCITSAAG